MKINRVYALGQDQHWLDSVKRAAENSLTVETVQCLDRLTEYKNSTQDITRNAITLVDVLFQSDIQSTAKYLHDLGWMHVIVVAAIPSEKEAYALLFNAVSFDYWQKTYSVSKIRAEIEQCLDELENEDDL